MKNFSLQLKSLKYISYTQLKILAFKLIVDFIGLQNFSPIKQSEEWNNIYLTDDLNQYINFDSMEVLSFLMQIKEEFYNFKSIDDSFDLFSPIDGELIILDRLLDIILFINDKVYITEKFNSNSTYYFKQNSLNEILFYFNQ